MGCTCADSRGAPSGVVRGQASASGPELLPPPTSPAHQGAHTSSLGLRSARSFELSPLLRPASGDSTHASCLRMGGTLILAAAAGAVAVLLAVRLWVVLRPRAAVPRRSLSLLVVAGSGGHTTEILRLLENLSDAYSPRHYIIADTDEMSAHKINSFEGNRADRNPSAMFTEYYIHRIPRSREVQQSWLSTVLTTLYSMWLSFPLTHRVKPDLAPDAQAQRPWLTGPAAPRHVGSSRTGAQTRVPCIGRRTLSHCATREALLRCYVTDQEHVFLSVYLPFSLGY
ncbi:UDP-N-acetylglucosamine transferase subunit ALG14 isoform X3 [Delphinus delphis]|uniref:UDP-N-acetylglucosamine transferase subunit ALG14 isoform X3 n=1 Tax=Delphinus delphis TaxID=9728 RepID=UPI0028C4B45D|nr:UDP-N-acetylglucosamine transferase subunit ALG14 homolog isoform X3 [Delphinus delphis]